MSNGGRRGRKIASCKAALLAGKTSFACCYCRKDFPFAQATLEHIVPLSHGGSWHHDNLALACLYCNMRRNKLVTKLKSITATFREQSYLCAGIVFRDGEWQFEAPSPKAVRGAA